LIGNPGVGKSVILNGLVGSVVFASGLSYGRGLTSCLQKHTVRGGNTYCDTPGLSDTMMRERAAEEIGRALRQGGVFKIIFVMTLEAGRVRPDDNATRKLVLEAAPEIGFRYSILINKVSSAQKKGLGVPQNLDSLRMSLMADCRGDVKMTDHISICGHIDGLEESPDTVPNLPNELLAFLDAVPPCVITPEKVSEINWNAYETARKDAEDLRRKYDANQAEWDRKFVDMQAGHARDKEENQRKYEKLESDLKSAADEAAAARKETAAADERARAAAERENAALHQQLAAERERTRAAENARQGGGGLWSLIPLVGPIIDVIKKL